MVGIQFQNVGGDAVADFNKVLSMRGIEAVSYDDMEDLGARIDVRIGNVYKSYYFINDAYDTNSKPVDGDVWADGEGILITSDDMLALGDGFWFMTKNATEGAILTVAGEVSEASSLSVTIPANNVFVIRSNPFPMAIDLAKIGVGGITAVPYEDMESTGARIDVRVGNIYKSYYYINDAYNEDSKPVEGDVWADGEGITVSGDAIDAGSSFWVNSPAEGSFTFER